MSVSEDLESISGIFGKNEWCQNCRDWYIGICEDCNPKPFIRPCHFCDKDVRMAKDSTEGKPVACFDHSYKFMENL